MAEETHGRVAVPKTQSVDLMFPFDMRHGELEDRCRAVGQLHGSNPCGTGILKWRIEDERPLLFQLRNGDSQLRKPCFTFRSVLAGGNKRLGNVQGRVPEEEAVVQC